MESCTSCAVTRRFLDHHNLVLKQWLRNVGAAGRGEPEVAAVSKPWVGLRLATTTAQDRTVDIPRDEQFATSADQLADDQWNYHKKCVVGCNDVAMW